MLVVFNGPVPTGQRTIVERLDKEDKSWEEK